MCQRRSVRPLPACVRESVTELSTRCILAFFTHAQNLAVMNYSGGVDGSWIGAQDLSLRVPALECMGELMTRAVVDGMRDLVDRRSLPWAAH